MNISVNKFPLWLLLIIITLILLPGVFMSFELCDSGFYLTFYDNFYTAPESVEYNFMYYLSGAFGGAVESLGDYGAMLRMRLAGLLLLLLSAVIAWRYARQTVSAGITAMAIICIFAGYASSPIIISYDIVTLLFLSLAVSLLVKGILNDNRSAILLSGLLTGILLFARIPNLLQFFLIILIPLYNQSAKREKWLLTAIFAGGYLAGLAIILIFMAVCGHIEVFLENINTLRTVSADPEASHGIGKLIMVQLDYYLYIFNASIKFVVIAFCLWIIRRYIKKEWLRVILALPIGAYFITLIWRIPAIGFIGSVTVPVLILMSFQVRDRKVALTAAAALLSALIFPLGSDGVGNVGSILYLLGTPLALGYLLKFRISLKKGEFFIPNVPIWIAASLFAVIWLGRTYCGMFYFDDTPIWKMRATSSSPKLAGILMSEERAEVTDEVLRALDRYVSPGDTLVVYGSAPMLNYLTSTRPFMGNSWPEQMSASRLDFMLKKEEKKGNFPVVCVQRFRTIGDSWGAPSDAFMRGEDADSNVYHSAKKWVVMEDFLNRNGYKKVAATPYFDILTR